MQVPFLVSYFACYLQTARYNVEHDLTQCHMEFDACFHFNSALGDEAIEGICKVTLLLHPWT